MDAVEAVEKYATERGIIIMAWPYMDNTAYQVLKKAYEVNPNALIVFIGEMGGCTADDDFWDSFKGIDDHKFSKANTLYQQWEGIHDNLYLGKLDK